MCAEAKAASSSLCIIKSVSTRQQCVTLTHNGSFIDKTVWRSERSIACMSYRWCKAYVRLLRGMASSAPPGDQTKGTAVLKSTHSFNARSVGTCCSWRFLRPILWVFQGCLGSPATSSHCSQTPKLALKKASFCLPRRRSCRSLSSAAADLKPTQLPCHHHKASRQSYWLPSATEVLVQN